MPVQESYERKPSAKRVERHGRERVRQVRGLILLALAALLFAVLRAGVHRVFTPGWWRFW